MTGRDLASRDEIDILFTISNRLTQAYTPAEWLEAISDYARDSGAVSGLLFYMNIDSPAHPEIVELAAEWTRGSAPAEGARFYLSPSALSRVVAATPVRPLLIPDLHMSDVVDAESLASFDRYTLRSTAVLPLNIKERWVGLCIFGWSEPHLFDEEDQWIYTAMLRLGGPVIDSMRLFEQTQKRATDLQIAKAEIDLLYESSSKLTGASDPDEVLEAVSGYARSTGADSGLLLYLANPHEDSHPTRSTVVAEWSTRAAPKRLGEHYGVDEHALNRVWMAQADRPTLVEDILDDPRVDPATREFLERLDIRATVILPLNNKGRWVAIVVFNWHGPHIFDQRDARIYTALIQQAAPAIDAMRLLDQSRERAAREEAARQETELLYEASAAINAATTFAGVTEAVGRLNIRLHSVVLTIWENFNFDGATYSEVVATANDSKQPVGERFSIDEQYPIARRLPPRGLWVIEDILNDPRLDPISTQTWLERGTLARIGVPLWINNTWIGNLAFLSELPRVYTARDRRLVAGIGDLVSAAVERIRLSAETTAARRRAETLAQVNAALSQATDEWAILAAVGLYMDQLEPEFMTLNYIEVGEHGDPRTMTAVAVRVLGRPMMDHPILNQAYDLKTFPATEMWASRPESALMISNVDTDAGLDDVTRGLLKGLDAGALVIIPLYSSGRWLGNMGCSWHAPREFTANDRVICEVLIRTAGAVVGSRRAFLAAESARRETEQRARELETVAKVGAAATAQLSVTTLLDTVTTLTRTNFDLCHAYIFLLTDNGDALVLASASDTDEGPNLPVGHRLPLRVDRCVVAVAARTLEGVIFDAPVAAPPGAPALPDTLSELAVPMNVGDKLIGVLDLHSRRATRFGEADMRVMGTLADQVAVAVQNARLYAQAQEVAVLEERNRLARELHDSVSQALYGIALGTRTARALLDRDPRQVAEPLDYVLSLAEAGLTEMRALIFELRPESLENEGLIAALNKQAASLQARHGVQVQTEFCDEPDAPLDVKEALYHIAREAMHNTVKHARASRVVVCLENVAGDLTLDVTDNGVGFNTGGTFPGHLGLQSMRERAARLGGSLAVESTHGLGTHIRVIVPLRA